MDRTCIAPVSNHLVPRLCGAPATTERTVEGLVCALCAEHAADVDTDAHIAQQAQESAAMLVSQGWTGGGSDYDLGAFLGDVDGLAERLGREPTHGECVALEAAIREALDAAADLS